MYGVISIFVYVDGFLEMGIVVCRENWFFMGGEDDRLSLEIKLLSLEVFLEVGLVVK